MHQTREAILALNDYEAPSLGSAFSVVCRFFGHTPAGVVSALGLDKKTARNALDGKAGVPVITKSLQARQKAADDHYELWLALGEMIFGESLDEYEERKLRRIIEDTHNAQSLLQARQERRGQLRARASSPYCGEADRPRERHLS